MDVFQKHLGGMALAFSCLNFGCEQEKIQKVQTVAAVASLSPDRYVEIHGKPIDGGNLTVILERYNAQRETSVPTPVSMWTGKINDVTIIAEKPVPADAEGIRGQIVDLQLENGGKPQRFVEVKQYLHNIHEWSPHR